MIWNWIKERSVEVSTHFAMIIAALQAAVLAANGVQERFALPMFLIAFLMAVTPESKK
jgi:hypothetical protein